MRFHGARDGYRGPLSSTSETLRRNFSFILHEPSTSPAVASMIEALGAGNADVPRRAHQLPVLDTREIVTIAPEIVLTACLGAPAALQGILNRLQPPPAIVAVDSPTGQSGLCLFFRAPAELVLPAWSADRLVVAVVVARPGGRSLELLHRGPYRWPDEQAAALQALEGFIRDHVDQWRPRRALWGAPAEVLLPEVLDELPSSGADPSR